jgi:hypothetical protein
VGSDQIYIPVGELAVEDSCGKWSPVPMELAVTRRPASLLLLTDDQRRRSASTDCCFLSGRRDAVATDCCSDSCLTGPPGRRLADISAPGREQANQFPHACELSVVLGAVSIPDVSAAKPIAVST